MPILHAVVLGLIQGATEFLPVSSSGHLILTRWLLGWELPTPQLAKAYDVALHVGTLTGAIAYLRRDLAGLARGAVESLRRRELRTSHQRLPWMIAVACVPAAVTGAAFESAITDHLGEPWLVGVMLIVFGLALVAADRVAPRRGADAFSWRDALLVGGAQALSLQPGVSRAGATISAARALGFERDAAARLSFIMGIPLIAGAALFEGVKVVNEGVDADFLVAATVGAATAAVTAWIAVWAVLSVVRRRSFLPFVAYRVLAGVAVLLLVGSPWR
ncbi:MAG TPA: undecaprenyl-diphosphate phosphatase [Acidimicrobiales bacterium]|nr:undecaprenyl-diphosphate phosphatase [Acidimicrobiales bacterium]